MKLPILTFHCSGGPQRCAVLAKRDVEFRRSLRIREESEGRIVLTLGFY